MQQDKVEKKQKGSLNLYVVRHGETEGNVDRLSYKEKADHSIILTENGISQARGAGSFMANRLYEEMLSDPENFGKIRVWFSSYYRARKTAGYIISELGKKFGRDGSIISYREEPFLIEQKAGLFDGLTDEGFMKEYPDAAKDYEKHLRYNGRFYAQSPLGDSRLDVVLKVKPFFGTILKDYEEQDIRHLIVVNHGVTLRAIVMAWKRYPPEWFDAEKNPGNCWIRHIHGFRKKGYVDEGYIYGEGAPIRDPMATQRELSNAEDIFMLKPGRAGTLVPPGVKLINPYDL